MTGRIQQKPLPICFNVAPEGGSGDVTALQTEKSRRLALVLSEFPNRIMLLTSD